MLLCSSASVCCCISHSSCFFWVIKVIALRIAFAALRCPAPVSAIRKSMVLWGPFNGFSLLCTFKNVKVQINRDKGTEIQPLSLWPQSWAAYSSSGKLKRLRKRSTRPAVSRIRCCPVKNGWQFEQTSIFSRGLMLSVWKLFPQAQLTVASM